MFSYAYADAGTRSFGSVTSSSSSKTMSSSFRRSAQRNEDKWWLPVPCVPDAGLTDKARKDLQQRRDCANQIRSTRPPSPSTAACSPRVGGQAWGTRCTASCWAPTSSRRSSCSTRSTCKLRVRADFF